jgi:hypothetical protein
MAENNSRQTVYQKLTSFFSGGKENPVVGGQSFNTQTVGVDRELLRSKDSKDIEVKKLEKQQSSYIRSLWNKATSLIKYQVLQNEARRIPSYYDYEKMEEYPIIGAALDIFMEECTQPNEKGNVLNIYSESERVKKELESMFYDKLNINMNIGMWMRNMCKYGDNFVYLDVDSDLGIINCKQLPTIEIEREDNDLLDYIISEKKSGTIFKWRTSRTVEFKDWQIAHFRLLIDDRRIPYGVSILEKARRFWRNLLLTEDAMRTIRLIRASDRRVFYINIGNIDPNDVGQYINSIADRYKRKKTVDPETGQEDLKMNVLGIDQDYFIPIRDANDGSKIDTIQGQTNLDIADIEYDLKLLVTALRVPKTYLNFEESVAEGKSLAMQDIRFAKTVNRIQLCCLQELNKIAMVHLIALGLEEECGNFVLSLNNPSIQAEVLRMELLTQKLDTYKAAVEIAADGIAPMSHARAKKLILNFTDNEIKEDLLQQRVERAIGIELQKTEQIIQNTKLFDEVDKIYGMPNAEYTQNTDGTTVGGAEGGGGAGGGDFSDLGGGLGGEMEGEAGGGELGGEGGGELGGEEGGGAEAPEAGGEEVTGGTPPEE